MSCRSRPKPASGPEHAGKLNLYLSAVDSLVRAPQDRPTIGVLLCKTKNRVIAEYALRDTSKPIGISEYQLVHALPARLETSLPSIEQIRARAGGIAAGMAEDRAGSEEEERKEAQDLIATSQSC